MGSLAPDDQAQLADLTGRWWHSIELPDGSVTAGYKTPEQLDREWTQMHVPPLAGKSVLDIGAWDGYFSFRAEDEGAAEVFALDSYVWSFDPFEKIMYEQRTREAGEQVRPFHEVPGLWQPDKLPGKRSFDFACKVRDSQVKSVVADFVTAELSTIPRADVVFFLGVLYHLEDPLDALRRLRALTREVAIIETEAIFLPRYPKLALVEFFPGDELHGDPTNWWAPTEAGLVGLCRAAGFTQVDVVGDMTEPHQARDAYETWLNPPTPRRFWKKTERRPDADDVVFRYRCLVHARPG